MAMRVMVSQVHHNRNLQQSNVGTRSRYSNNNNRYDNKEIEMETSLSLNSNDAATSRMHRKDSRLMRLWMKDKTVSNVNNTHSRNESDVAISQFQSTGQDRLDQATLWLIHANNPIVFYWYCLLLSVLILLFLSIPYRIAFKLEYERRPYDWLIDGLLFCDVILSCIKMHENKQGRLITTFPESMYYYLKYYAVWDLLALFPLDFILSSSWGRLLKLPKLFQIPALVNYLRSSFNHHKIFQGTTHKHSRLVLPESLSPTFRMTKALCMTMGFVHACTCGWYLMGRAENESGDELSWLDRSFGGIEDDDEFNQYLVSLYAVCTMLTTVGFGDITPRTNSEVIFVICLELCGAIFFSYITASIVAIVATMDRQASVYAEKLGSLVSYLKERKKYIDPGVSSLVLNRMSKSWQHQAFSVNPDIIHSVPMIYRYKIARSMLGPLYKSSRLIRAMDEYKGFIADLADSMIPQEVIKGDVIAAKGFDVEYVYFLQSGSVVVLSSLWKPFKVVGVFEQGDVIGHVALLETFSGQWWGHLRCRESGMLWKIHLNTLNDLLYHNVRCRKMLQSDAERSWSEIRSILRAAVKHRKARVDRIRTAARLFREKSLKRKKIANENTKNENEENDDASESEVEISYVGGSKNGITSAPEIVANDTNKKRTTLIERMKGKISLKRRPLGKAKSTIDSRLVSSRDIDDVLEHDRLEIDAAVRRSRSAYDRSSSSDNDVGDNDHTDNIDDSNIDDTDHDLSDNRSHMSDIVRQASNELKIDPIIENEIKQND